MMRIIPKITVFLCFLCMAAVPALASPADSTAETSPWKFGAGVSFGKLTPVMIEGSIAYKAATLHVAGLGFHKGANDFWCGMRGSFGWRIPKDLPFSVELGVGGGYEFAEAPNAIHQAVNDANGAKYLYPYNYKEGLDISGEIRIHLFGLFSQISLPIYKFKDHDAPSMLWRVGYVMEF